MKVGIKIMPKRDVLDVQGRAVQETLSHNGFILESCSVGKYIEVEVPAENFEDAKVKVEEMTKFVLYNPLIESYEIRPIEGAL